MAKATRRPRLARTESRKKRTASKAAETRARNKAAKATQNGRGSGIVQPDDASKSALDPQLPQLPQDPLSHAHSTHLPTFTQRQRSPSPTSDPDGGDHRPSSSTAVSSVGLSSLTTTSSAGPSSNSSRSAPSRRTQEKKLVLYRTYDPKEALGLAGREHKGRWLFLRETVRGLLKAQKFQATQSWTKHTLAQRSAVVTEAQEELAKNVTADPEWTRVISQPLLPQVIEDIARDCCNNISSYKLRKQKRYGTG